MTKLNSYLRLPYLFFLFPNIFKELFLVSLPTRCSIVKPYPRHHLLRSAFLQAFFLIMYPLFYPLIFTPKFSRSKRGGKVKKLF
jgi:hypothetical protein